LKSDTDAQGVTHDVGSFNLEMRNQGRDVVPHQLETQRTVDIGGASMGLQVDGDDLTGCGARRQVGAEHFDGADATVQQYQRFTGAMNLIIHLEAIHVRVFTLCLLDPPGCFLCCLHTVLLFFRTCI
jgi:hypothetical protein